MPRETWKLEWDKTSEHFYETGVEMGVLYPQNSLGAYPKGVVWNGLSSVTESPSGAEATPIYADNIKYLNLYSVEEFGATVECFTYPDEFKACCGESELVKGVTLGQQNRTAFGMCYRTIIGNDTEFNDHAYKIHIIYGAMASPTDKQYSTVNDSPDVSPMSYTLTTTPVKVAGFKPTALVTIDSRTTDPTKLAALEDILYGTGETDARLPLPDEIKTLLTPVVPGP